MRWAVLVGDRQVPYDGVLDHAHRLADELAGRHEVSVAVRQLDGSWSEDLEPVLGTADVVLLHYAPWNLGLGSRHWRFLAEWRGLRRRAPGARWVLFLHERATPDPAQRMNRLAQQLQFAWIASGCQGVVGATPLLTSRARRRLAHAQVPVGSNLPDGRGQRDAQRRALGLSPADLVVGSFVQGYRAAEAPYVRSAVAAAGRAARGRVVHLALGSDPADTDVRGVERLVPGPLSAEALAAHLACVDLYVSPYPDGMSARRTTLVAALQHATAVISNGGAATESWLSDLDAVHLAPLTVDGFAQAAEELAGDAAVRAALSRRAREAHESHFAWPVLAARLERFVASA